MNDVPPQQPNTSRVTTDIGSLLPRYAPNPSSIFWVVEQTPILSTPVHHLPVSPFRPILRLLFRASDRSLSNNTYPNRNELAARFSLKERQDETRIPLSLR